VSWHRPRPFAAPVGVHHPIPTDRTFTRPHPTVKDPQDPPPVPEVPVLAVQAPPPQPEAAADPAPVVTEVRLNRGILMGLRRDYARDGLPVFRATVRDRYQLHELAMRAPRTINGGELP
jgi:hypothetical protein